MWRKIHLQMSDDVNPITEAKYTFQILNYKTSLFWYNLFNLSGFAFLKSQLGFCWEFCRHDSKRKEVLLQKFMPFKELCLFTCLFYFLFMLEFKLNQYDQKWMKQNRGWKLYSSGEALLLNQISF